jgi:hypothetical protein
MPVKIRRKALAATRSPIRDQISQKNVLQSSRRSATVFDMGDKSPKTKNKQAAQKQAKANSAAKQKNDNRAAKQTVKPKR